MPSRITDRPYIIALIVRSHLIPLSGSCISKQSPPCCEVATLDRVTVLPTSAVPCSSPFRQSAHCFALMLHDCQQTCRVRVIETCQPEGHGKIAVGRSCFASSPESRSHIERCRTLHVLGRPFRPSIPTFFTCLFSFKFTSASTLDWPMHRACTAQTRCLRRASDASTRGISENRSWESETKNQKSSIRNQMSDIRKHILGNQK